MLRQREVRTPLLLVALVLAVSVVLLGTTILNVALPELQDSLHASTTAQQWILNTYTLTFAGFLLLSGAVGDRLGYRRVLAASLIVFAVAAALASVAPNSGVLIAMRAVMGVAAAGIMPITLAVITRTVSRERQAAAITTWAAFSGLSIALGPLLGGALLSAGLWWGSVLALVAVLAVVALVAVWAWVPALPGSGVGELRAAPTLASIAGIGLLVWGVLEGGKAGHWISAGALVPLVSGVIVLAVLARVEARHAQPLADVILFRSEVFSVSTVVLTVGSFAVYGFLYFGTFYLEVLRNYSPVLTGACLIPLSAGFVVAAPVSRRLTARLGPLPTLGLGMAITAAALASVSAVGVDTSVAVFAILTFVVAFGFGLVLSPGTAAAMGAVPRDRAGAGSALVNTLRQVGSALGVAILGSILWTSYGGHVGPSLAGLSGPARATARQSLSSTLLTAGTRPGVASAARQSFVDAMHLTTVIAAAVCAAGMLGIVVVLARQHRSSAAHAAAH